jgi:hypothetical protein
MEQIEQPHKVLVQVWPAGVIERFIFDFIGSFKSAMDVLETGDKLMPLQDNIQATYTIFRQGCADMLHVLNDHNDAVLSPKHRDTKAVLNHFHLSLVAHDVIAKPEYEEQFVRELCAFVKALNRVMNTRNKNRKRDMEVYCGFSPATMANRRDSKVQRGVPVLLPEVSEDSGQAESAGESDTEANTGAVA